MKKRLIFPIFNAVLGAMFGALIGYYVSQLGIFLTLGVVVGFFIGLISELLFNRLLPEHWLYQRRVLLVALIEIPLAVFLLGPYAYVVAGTQADPHRICCETPIDYGAKTYEEVVIPTKDGNLLAGWYVAPKDPSGNLIILLHGSHGDRRGVAWHARQLILAGYGVLLYDQRALGESTGDRTYMGWIEGYDLLDVIAYLESRPDVNTEKLGVVGLSGGGHIALNAAYLGPDKISALWVDGIQAQGIADFPEPENAGEQFATFINALILKMAEIYLGRSAPPAFVDILPELGSSPMTLVASGLDDFENRVNRKYAQIIGPNAQMWLIEDVPHVGGYRMVPDEYRQHMLSFFTDTLKEE